MPPDLVAFFPLPREGSTGGRTGGWVVVRSMVISPLLPNQMLGPARERPRGRTWKYDDPSHPRRRWRTLVGVWRDRPSGRHRGSGYILELKSPSLLLNHFQSTRSSAPALPSL